MVRDRFAPGPFVYEERVAAAIGLTRFPVPMTKTMTLPTRRQA
jgi:hypothetical protein